MKIFGIRDIPLFMKYVRSCTGNISFEDKNGKWQDLKSFACHIEGMEQFFSGMQMEELTVYVENAEDKTRMINYMVETAVMS